VPRTRSPQRLDDIVDAALQVFLARGYQRTRMTDVATQAQVSPGLLYTYAASKEALFHLVLRRELGVDLATIVLPAPDPEPGAVTNRPTPAPSWPRSSVSTTTTSTATAG
jgi:AcrR family transcriptional regulator